MKTIILFFVFTAACAAQVEIDSTAGGGLPVAQIVPVGPAGTAVIGAGDSVTVSIDGLHPSDIAEVSYAHIGSVPAAEGVALPGWAIWQSGVLTLYGQSTYTVTYLIMRLR